MRKFSILPAMLALAGMSRTVVDADALFGRQRNRNRVRDYRGNGARECARRVRQAERASPAPLYHQSMLAALRSNESKLHGAGF